MCSGRNRAGVCSLKGQFLYSTSLTEETGPLENVLWQVLALPEWAYDFTESDHFQT